MDSRYVEMRNGGYYVAGTRVSLDSVVYAYKSGDAAETIWQNFPSLTLEQVYGAITFYLANWEEVEANMEEGEKSFFESVPPIAAARPEMYVRLQRLRGAMSRRG